MKNKRLTEYLPLFISIFMLLFILGLSIYSGFIIFAMINDMESFYIDSTLNNWGVTVSSLKIFMGITLLIGWGTWIWLAGLIDRKLKILFFPYYLYKHYLGRTRPNLLKIIARKRTSSLDNTNKKENT